MMRSFTVPVFTIGLILLSVLPLGAVEVQVGAFSDRNNAEHRAGQLRQRGYSTRIQQSASGLNRVRAINLSRAEKKRLIGSLESRGIDYFVIGDEPSPEQQFEQSSDGDSEYVVPPMRFGHRVRLSERIRKRLKEAMGTEYVWGGESFEEGGFDCSGLLVWLFQYNDMPRTSRQMWKWTTRVKKSMVRPGDFVFFNFESTDEPDHVGLYLGDDRFVHASSSYGVIEANFSKQYYQKSFYGIGRPPQRTN